MQHQNNELAKMFLNIEKQLIDFRISQIDNGNVSYVNSTLDKQDLKEMIVSVVREEVRNALGVVQQPVAQTVEPSVNVENVSEEVIASKVMETAPEAVKEVEPDSIEVPEKKTEEKVVVNEIVRPATSKGGSVFKVFEPLNLNTVSTNLPENSVYLPSKNTEKTKMEAMRVALS